MNLTYPLDGIRVIALEQYIAGPFCTMWLADAGAEVIKIERPGTGDPRRNYPPVVTDKAGNKAFGGFLIFNRNKKSLTLDLKNEKGKEIFKELVKHADVVVDNFGPETVEKLGLGYEVLQQINPRLIYAAISGFGRLKDFKGIYSDRPAFDNVIQAMGAMIDGTKEEKEPPFWVLADLFTSVVTGYAIVLALFIREKTGEGQFIDSSMYDNLVSLNAIPIMIYSFTGDVISRSSGGISQAPSGTYEVKDGGHVALIVPSELTWPRLCKAIGREDLIENPRTISGVERVKNKNFLEAIIQEWMKERTMEEVVETLLKYGVPVGPIQNIKDLINCPHLKARKMLLEIEDPVGGKRIFARSPFRMSKTKEVPALTAPRLGQHTELILKELLQYDSQKILELQKENII